MYRRFFKRVADIIVASVALAILSPLILGVAAIVGIAMGSPILFRQTRPGLRGVPFTILKFRTMRVLPEGQERNGFDGLTRVGRLLRSTSLDELPELLNVLKGDMSVVGPRPLLMRYLELYTPEQARRHEVRPGITGLAQVRGRNTLDWERRFAVDVEYVDRCSFSLDLMILLKTVQVTLSRTGITEPGGFIETEFLGSSSRSQGSTPLDVL